MLQHKKKKKLTSTSRRSTKTGKKLETKEMKTKPLTFLLALTFLFLFSGSSAVFVSPIERQKHLLKLKSMKKCEKCSLKKANLSEADLRGAYLEEVDLKGAYLSDANLSKANLEKANLSGAYLSGVNMSETNLRGADLSGAYLKNIINLDAAIKCKTIFPWGEENSECK